MHFEPLKNTRNFHRTEFPTGLRHNTRYDGFNACAAPKKGAPATKASLDSSY
jgi:hypothetical protein